MGQRLFANPLQTTDTVACCRKNFRHNLNVFFVSKNKSNGRSDVKRKFARNELTARAFASTAVSGV